MEGCDWKGAQRKVEGCDWKGAQRKVPHPLLTAGPCCKCQPAAGSLGTVWIPCQTLDSLPVPAPGLRVGPCARKDPCGGAGGGRWLLCIAQHCSALCSSRPPCQHSRAVPSCTAQAGPSCTAQAGHSPMPALGAGTARSLALQTHAWAGAITGSSNKQGKGPVHLRTGTGWGHRQSQASLKGRGQAICAQAQAGAIAGFAHGQGPGPHRSCRHTEVLAVQHSLVWHMLVPSSSFPVCRPSNAASGKPWEPHNSRPKTCALQSPRNVQLPRLCAAAWHRYC